MEKRAAADQKASTDEFDNLDLFVAMDASAASNTRDEDGTKARREKLIEGMALAIKRDLHLLFYPVDFSVTKHPSEDRPFYEALSAFERRAGLKPDGMFTLAEYSRLQTLARLETETTISATLSYVAISGSLASASGTWTIQGEDRIAYPVNKSEVRCWRPDGSCTVFTADVQLPTDSLDRMTLMTNVTYFDITNWSSTEVQATSSSECRRTTLTLNAETKQAYEITADLTKGGCPIVGPLGRPRIATLVDGFKLIEQHYRERREVLNGISNSPRTRIEEAFRALQPGTASSR